MGMLAVARVGMQAETEVWKEAVTTVFWVGEDATEDNSFIHNRASAWDEDWEGTFGGYDDPDERCGYVPCSFRPSQNPFYVALPYNDLENDGTKKKNAHVMPWYDPAIPAYVSQMHGQWVAVEREGKVCYGQVRDTGPYEQDDIAYVFGDTPKPKNTIGMKAGLDVSPAMRDCLELGGVGLTFWKFIDEADVPEGPWLSW